LTERDVTTQGTRQARTSSGGYADPGVARQLSELARELQAEPDMASLLQRIVEAAVAEVDGATHAGITVVDHGCFSTAAQTSELAARIDRIQYAVGDGPCLTSLRESATVRSDDLRREPRWPRFAAEAVQQGVASMLAFQLFVGADDLGALNLFAEQPHAFTEEAENIGLLLASHAAIAMQGARNQLNFRTALDSRDVIGQAKGILMERYKIDAGRAFHMLIAASQHSHRKLRQIAEELCATGVLSGVEGD
jgi:GAF domain-containing protein